MDWMLLPYKRYAEFSGRSRRMEYWMFTLFSLLVTLVFVFMMLAGGFDLAAFADPTPPSLEFTPLFWVGAAGLTIFVLASFLPGIAVTVRRFHDRDMSGWWVLGFAVLSNLPYVGWIAGIVQIVIMAMSGTSGANRFGDDPLGTPHDARVFS